MKLKVLNYVQKDSRDEPSRYQLQRLIHYFETVFFESLSQNDKNGTLTARQG